MTRDSLLLLSTFSLYIITLNSAYISLIDDEMDLKVVSDLGLLLEDAEFHLITSDSRAKVEEKWLRLRFLVIRGCLVLINHF